MLQPTSNCMHHLGVVSLWYCAASGGALFHAFFWKVWVLLSTTAHAQTRPKQSLEVFGSMSCKDKMTHQKGGKHECFVPLIWSHFSIFTARNTAPFLPQQNAAMPRRAYGSVAEMSRKCDTHKLHRRYIYSLAMFSSALLFFSRSFSLWIV